MLEGNGLSKTSGTVVTFAKNVSAAKSSWRCMLTCVGFKYICLLTGLSDFTITTTRWKPLLSAASVRGFSTGKIQRLRRVWLNVHNSSTQQFFIFAFSDKLISLYRKDYTNSLHTSFSKKSTPTSNGRVWSFLRHASAGCVKGIKASAPKEFRHYCLSMSFSELAP